VTKRDETTGDVETVIQVDDPSSIRDAFGALWVSTRAGAKVTVVKIDPAIAEVVSTVDVSVDSAPVIEKLAIEAGEGAVWAIDDQGHLTKIEPLSGKAVARFDVGAGAGLAVGGDAVWVADNLHDQISEIDPATGKVLTTIDVPFAPDVIEYLGGTLWTIDTGAATVTPIDTSTLQPGRSIGVATGPVAISGGLGSVWIAGIDSVTRIDVVTDVAVTIPVDFAASTVAVDARTRAVWLITRPPGYAYG
jgi:hypothetical protein